MSIYTKQRRETKLNSLRPSYNITEQRKLQKAPTDKQQICANNNIKLPHSCVESSSQPWTLDPTHSHHVFLTVQKNKQMVTN